MKRIVRTTGKPEPTEREAHLEHKLRGLHATIDGLKAELEDITSLRDKAVRYAKKVDTEAEAMRHQHIALVVDRAEYASPEHAETKRRLVIRDRHSGRIVEGVVDATVEQAYDTPDASAVARAGGTYAIEEKMNVYHALRLLLRYPGTPPNPETLAGMHPWEE